MDFSVETDPGRCRMLWDRFSPKATLFDLWEYRDCFQQGYGYDPHFIVGKACGRQTGILPLWYEKKHDYYTFYGGMFPESNTFYVNDPTTIKAFLEQCPVETWLCYIHYTQRDHYPFTETETRYCLDLTRYDKSIDGFLASFDKKHRKNLRYDLKQFEKHGYSIRYNHLADFDRLVSLNKKRFGDESDYVEDEMVESMKLLMQTAHEQGRLSLISIVIDDVAQAVELAVAYNGTYSVLAGGKNIDYENIGKPLVIEHIKNALVAGIYHLDFLSSDSGWKKRWHLAEEPVYEYKNY